MSNKDLDNAAKQKAMDLAEESRETDWRFPSFTAEMFRGKFRWDLMHPYPVQSKEDQKIGDDFIADEKHQRMLLSSHPTPPRLQHPLSRLAHAKPTGVFALLEPVNVSIVSSDSFDLLRSPHGHTRKRLTE